MRLFNTLAAVAALAVSTSAIAADLPSTAAPAPIAPSFAAPATQSSSFNWSGFYAGVNGGFAVDNSDMLLGRTPVSNFYQSLESAGFGRHNNDAKFTGGGQLGYAYQMGAVVLGLETDINYLNSDRKYVGTNFDIRGKTQYFGTIRPVIGFTLTDHLLAYGTGGLAYGHTKTHAITGAFNAKDSDIRWGWTIGAGAKYAVTEDLFLKGEYLYTDLGSKTYALATPGGVVGAHVKDETAFHTFRVGLDYRFY